MFDRVKSSFDDTYDVDEKLKERRVYTAYQIGYSTSVWGPQGDSRLDGTIQPRTHALGNLARAKVGWRFLLLAPFHLSLKLYSRRYMIPSTATRNFLKIPSIFNFIYLPHFYTSSVLILLCWEMRGSIMIDTVSSVMNTRTRVKQGRFSQNAAPLIFYCVLTSA